MPSSPPSPVATGMVERLDNPVRAYAWGSATVIPELLGRPATGEPQAELWLGAHPVTPSRLAAGGTLLDRIGADPVGELSPAVVDRFGPRLPFLLKVLAPGRAISIQAHPTAAQAREVRERDGDATYVDDWAKPELLVAIAPFTVFVGMRTPEEVGALAKRLADTADLWGVPG